MYCDVLKEKPRGYLSIQNRGQTTNLKNRCSTPTGGRAPQNRPLSTPQRFGEVGNNPKNITVSENVFARTPVFRPLGAISGFWGLRKCSPGWSSSSFGCGKHMGGDF